MVQAAAQTSSNALMTVRDLYQSYQHKTILRQVNFELHEAEIVTLLGRNGTGKTTLLKVLAKLLTFSRGKIEYGTGFAGISLFLPDGFLYEDLTLRENLSLYAGLCLSDKAWLAEIIKRLDLDPFIDNKVRNLSRGQKLRGALCRCFLQKASIYLLDEPLTGLDQTSMERLVQLFVFLRSQKKTVLLATHQIESLITASNRWWQMENGRLTTLSDPQKLLDEWRRL